MFREITDIFIENPDEKVIIFFPSEPIYVMDNIIPDYYTTWEFINNHEHCIYTYAMSLFNMGLIHMGYRIFLVNYNCDKVLEIREHMPELDKDLRLSHNILRMFLRGAFDTFLQS